MGKYTANGSLGSANLMSSTYKTPISLVGGTGVRPKLCEFSCSCFTAADAMFEYLLQRLTGAGTATSVTPEPVDPADPAAECTVGANHTAEPTYTSGDKLVELSQHQRGTARWQAYDDDARIVVPATSNNGVGLQMRIATGTPEARAHFAWLE